MGNVTIGYFIIAIVIGVGYLAGHAGVGGPNAQRTLQQIAFYVASPALLFTVLAQADLEQVFSQFILVALISMVATMTLYGLIARWWFGLRRSDLTLGALTAGYVNANNIGIPVAVYILGDAQYVAPILFLQLIVFSPIALSILDADRTGRVNLLQTIARPVKNPIIVGSAAGVIVALTGVELPQPVFEPFEIIGGAAVPLMLLAFGMSLRGHRPFQAGSGRKQVALAAAFKLAFMPLVAWFAAEVVFGLPEEQVFASTVLAALPTAQNIYTFAVNYRVQESTTRDTVLLTTLGAFGSLMLISLLLN